MHGTGVGAGMNLYTLKAGVIYIVTVVCYDCFPCDVNSFMELLNVEPASEGSTKMWDNLLGYLLNI